jgi:hypothetical protein
VASVPSTTPVVGELGLRVAMSVAVAAVTCPNVEAIRPSWSPHAWLVVIADFCSAPNERITIGRVALALIWSVVTAVGLTTARRRLYSNDGM